MSVPRIGGTLGALRFRIDPVGLEVGGQNHLPQTSSEALLYPRHTFVLVVVLVLVLEIENGVLKDDEKRIEDEYEDKDDDDIQQGSVLQVGSATVPTANQEPETSDQKPSLHYPHFPPPRRLSPPVRFL